MATGWDDDERLMADLEAALRAEREVPSRLVEIGKAAYAWHSVDAELASLTFDSATVSTEELAGVRSESASLRALTFAASLVTIELEVTGDALIGQLVPAQAGEIEVLMPDGEGRTVAVDEVGWFVIRPRPVGVFRLMVRTGEGDVLTEWTVL